VGVVVVKVMAVDLTMMFPSHHAKIVSLTVVTVVVILIIEDVRVVMIGVLIRCDHADDLERRNL
jgi:hypothetical protein